MLKIEDLSKRFGGIDALADLNLEIPSGMLFGLIGPNGSGKTTLFNVISGLYRADHGRIEFNKRDISRLKPHDIVRLGVARTFQNLRLYGRMTVFDNVWSAQHTLADSRLLFTQKSKTTERQKCQQVDHLLQQFGLADRREELAKNLPLPDQRRLELARALARSPSLLLLDEPAGGMTPAETIEMARLIRQSAGAAPDCTCIVIEHKINMIEAVCEQLCVLNFGRKIATGAPREVLQQPAVVEAYLGRQHA